MGVKVTMSYYKWGIASFGGEVFFFFFFFFFFFSESHFSSPSFSYPDATYVWTHRFFLCFLFYSFKIILIFFFSRHPKDVLGSALSLVANFHSMSTNEVDIGIILYKMQKKYPFSNFILFYFSLFFIILGEIVAVWVEVFLFQCSIYYI